MTVKIVMPKVNNGKVRTAMGTRVFNKDGSEIEDITDIKINLSCDGIAEAVITIGVYDIENFTDIKSFIVNRKKTTFLQRLKFLFGL